MDTRASKMEMNEMNAIKQQFGVDAHQNNDPSQGLAMADTQPKRR